MKSSNNKFKENLKSQKKTYQNFFPEIKFYFSPIPNEFTKIRFRKIYDFFET
jgi:hypothetical protein